MASILKNGVWLVLRIESCVGKLGRRQHSRYTIAISDFLLAFSSSPCVSIIHIAHFLWAYSFHCVVLFFVVTNFLFSSSSSSRYNVRESQEIVDR